MTDDRDDATRRERRLFEILEAYEEARQSGNPPDREAWLAEHPDLASELAGFLDAQESLLRLTEPFRPLAEAVATAGIDPEDIRPGRLVGYFGDYELIEEIARGGMGVVYRARQLSLNRSVALKMILAGTLAGEADVRRFRNEAEAVACLDHPGIVPIFEVGEHQGQSYLAMKLVEGGSLAEKLPGYLADPRSAAGLLSGVARAVHHAHQRGVLHRDLKPSNILVDRQGRPHVTDFGLARRIEGGSELTQSGALLGSPPYMAPEQTTGHRGEVTTATDVYGLGAVLYAALSGRPPFKSYSVMDTIEQVRHRAPEPPISLNPRVDRDLQTICLKCLDKDPTRRYASAEALAEDLDRWVEGRPILARPSGRVERAWRWARRNPVVATLSTLVVLLAIAGVSGLAVSNAMISRRNAAVEQERDRAKNAQIATEKALKESEESRRQAEAVSGFLVAAFRKPDPSQDGRDLKVVDLLEKAGGDLVENPAIEPRIKGELLNALGETFLGLSLLPQAVVMFEKAHALLRGVLGPEHDRTLVILDNLGEAHLSAGRSAEAIAILEPTVKARESTMGFDHQVTLACRNNLAEAYLAAGRFAEAVKLHGQTSRSLEAKLGADHLKTLVSRSNLANAYYSAGRTDEALSIHESTLAAIEKKLGPDHPSALKSRNNLAAVYLASGLADKAIDLQEKALKSRIRVLGPNHQLTLIARGNLASTYLEVGRTAEAVAINQEVLAAMEKELGPDNPETIVTLGNLAVAYDSAGRSLEAIELHERALAGFRKVLSPNHQRTLQCLANLASALDAAGRHARSEPIWRERLDRALKMDGPDHPFTAGLMAQLGVNLLRQEKWAYAEPLLRQCLSVREKVQPDAWNTFNARAMLGGSLLELGRYAESEPLLLSGHEGLKAREAAIPGFARTYIGEAAGRIVRLYEAWGRPDKAREWKARLGLADLPDDVFARP